MPRASVKQNKSMYQEIREGLGLSREKASELLESIPPERIERIENGKFTANPEEVIIMAEKYKAPQLCNHYCANECAIGKRYVPEVKLKDLEKVVLSMLAAVNSVKKNEEKLIDIAEDGIIEAGEIDAFIDIQEKLEKISLSVKEMQLWSEKMIATGGIDKKAYNAALAKRKKK